MTTKTSPIGFSDITHEVNMFSPPGEKPYLSLLIRPIPDPPNPAYNALSGEHDNADIFGVDFEELVDDYLRPYDAGHGKGRAEIEEMKAWAEALETAASKIRGAIAAIQIQLTAKP